MNRAWIHAAVIAAILASSTACGGGSAKQSPNQPSEPPSTDTPKVDQDKVISTIDFEDGKIEGSGFEVTDPSQKKPKMKKKKEGEGDPAKPEAAEGGG
jgi:hypothetical protein